ncbi:MAG TPA: M48 family metallopeptidase [Bryobacteraceae bacterium]|nr:M48 family metallopeptidase [Bryobacteraceae bacterium]
MRNFLWLLAPALAVAQLKHLEPGWNLFSPRQDIQLGEEASAEIERQKPIVHNRELDSYFESILQKLERSPYAQTSEPFPFRIHVVRDKTVNAFALPGGPIFVNTGLIEAAENEAQLAGVIAHEMSHVVLRHGTNQATKQNLVALPALLAEALIGNSMLGQLAKIGLNFGANSVFLKFSRTNEAEADYNGAEIVADAGYDPRQLAVFFEKLEAKHGPGNAVTQFLSDHPNPGNRVAAVNEEARYLPRRNYVLDETGRFHAMQALVRQQPEPPITEARASGRLVEFRGPSFSIAYPENWDAFEDRVADGVLIAPHRGFSESEDRKTQIVYGFRARYFHPKEAGVELNRDTDELVRQFKRDNAGMRTGRETRSILVAGEPALLTTLYSLSPYAGQQEVDVLATVARPQGLFYAIFVAPQSEFDSVQKIFEQMLESVRFF